MTKVHFETEPDWNGYHGVKKKVKTFRFKERRRKEERTLTMSISGGPQKEKKMGKGWIRPQSEWEHMF